MLLDRIEKWYDRIGKKLLGWTVSIIIIYFFLAFNILGLVAPFIIAWLLASLLNPFVTILHRRLRIPRGLGTLLSMATILTAFFGFLTFLIRQLWIQIVSFADAFPIYKEEVFSFLDLLEVRFQTLTANLPMPEAFNSLDGVIKELLDYMSTFLNSIVKAAYGIISSVPNGLFFVIITLIATFFMTKDNAKIRGFIKAQMPEHILGKIRMLKEGLASALGGYVKTQLILMTYTFSICLIGLSVIRADYALLIALGIAIFDAIPMFGSGAILIPWGLYNLILGNIPVGIGLLCIYGLIIFVRQVMEPKVLSNQIGVYALVTVMAMYIGFRLVGVLGIIIGPVTVVMIQTLQKIGVLPAFKPYYEEEKVRRRGRR
ncbi:MAG: sporulation integral membrane protein YtvI [Cellulosilyticaceae bacterium]